MSRARKKDCVQGRQQCRGTPRKPQCRPLPRIEAAQSSPPVVCGISLWYSECVFMWSKLGRRGLSFTALYPVTHLYSMFWIWVNTRQLPRKTCVWHIIAWHSDTHQSDTAIYFTALHALYFDWSCVKCMFCDLFFLVRLGFVFSVTIPVLERY